MTGAKTRPPIGQFATGKSVLVAEGHALVAFDLKCGLEEYGHSTVELAASGIAAFLDGRRTISVDAAVVDLDMAGGNAASLVEFLAMRSIPVIATTAWPVAGGAPGLNGAAAILAKPFQFEELLAILSRLLLAGVEEHGSD